MHSGDGPVHTPSKRRSFITPQSLFNLRQFYLKRAKLKTAGRVSALLSGFALVAIIELDTSEAGYKAPPALVAVFTTVSCLLVVVLMLAVMISTCISPHIESYLSIASFVPLEESPHFQLKVFIELAWIFSTVIGIFLFLAVMVLACWVKFWHASESSAIASAAVIIPSLFVFVALSALFYRTLATHAVQQAQRTIERLDLRMDRLEAGQLTSTAQVADV